MSSAAVTKWEFAYVDLHCPAWGRERQATVTTVVKEVQRIIAEYGEAGWEPVGPVTFSVDFGPQEKPYVPVLMFKRPL